MRANPPLPRQDEQDEGMIQLGLGRVALTGDVAALLEYFDATFQQWASALGAQPYHLPSLMSVAEADQFEVLDSFGHLATFVSHVAGGESTPDGLPGSLEGKWDHGDIQRSLERPPALLRTAVCYQLFRCLAGHEVDCVPFLATARGSCFRLEDGEFEDLARLWEFSMRELVVIGSPGQVRSFIARLIRTTSEYAQHIGLNCKLALATDPFYAGARGKVLAQRILRLKRELLARVDADQRLAVASFNLHGDFFTSRASITIRGRLSARSGCVAFGLERWVLAFLARYGTDARRWPACTRKKWCSHVVA